MSESYDICSRVAFEAYCDTYDKVRSQTTDPYIDSEAIGLRLHSHHLFSTHVKYAAVQATETSWDKVLEFQPQYNDGLNYYGIRGVVDLVPDYIKMYCPDMSIRSLQDVKDFLRDMPNELVLVSEYGEEVPVDKALEMLDYPTPFEDHFIRDEYHWYDSEGFPCTYRSFY